MVVVRALLARVGCNNDNSRVGIILALSHNLEEGPPELSFAHDADVNDRGIGGTNDRRAHIHVIHPQKHPRCDVKHLMIR